jgi:hypothetical protein
MDADADILCGIFPKFGKIVRVDGAVEELCFVNPTDLERLAAGERDATVNPFTLL